jgi:hypothetical protein
VSAEIRFVRVLDSQLTGACPDSIEAGFPFLMQVTLKVLAHFVL